MYYHDHKSVEIFYKGEGGVAIYKSKVKLGVLDIFHTC